MNLSYADNFPEEIVKLLFSHRPSTVTAESIKSFKLEHNKGPFCANDKFPHEHKQSQTSAHND